MARSWSFCGNFTEFAWDFRGSESLRSKHLLTLVGFRRIFVDPLKTKITLRARGTLISEPRFSTPCEMRFFPREKGKMAFVKGFSLKRPFSLSRVGKIASRRG